jgi:hypothetical protein
VPTGNSRFEAGRRKTAKAARPRRSGRERRRLQRARAIRSARTPQPRRRRGSFQERMSGMASNE